MQLTPTIAVHMTAALGAVALGPVALWARLGRQQRPRLHRAVGFTWVALMLVTAISALFIRDFRLPNIAGYTPIHLLVPFTLVTLVGAFHALAKGNIRAHRSRMQMLYVGACLVAGAFTLLPGRYLGDLLWSHVGMPDVLASSALVQLLARHPQAIGQILRGTPTWVWGLLAGLLVLGVTQLRARNVGAVRTALVPVGMLAFSASAMVGAFAASHLFTEMLSAWIAVAGLVALAFLPGTPTASYDPARRQFRVPGSVLPLLMIVGIFLVKWAVGVELALAPQRVQDSGFVLAVACTYGVFNGLFAGRALRLARLVRTPAAPLPTAA
jgi:uncharacterized membrane protein